MEKSLVAPAIRTFATRVVVAGVDGVWNGVHATLQPAHLVPEVAEDLAVLCPAATLAVTLGEHGRGAHYTVRLKLVYYHDRYEIVLT